MVDLRVEAFRMKVEAFYKLVLNQGVEAPFQERLVNGIRGLELPSSSDWRTREGGSLLKVGACMLV